MRKIMFLALLVISCTSGFTYRVSPLNSSIITIRRGHCYGTCPVYIAEIYKSGKIEFTGYQFTNFKGDTTLYINEDILKKIIDKFYECDFYNLNESYTQLEEIVFNTTTGKSDTIFKSVTDLPATKISINYKNKFHSVYNYFGGPNKLYDLESYIEKSTGLDKLIFK